ncbi:hypothetical protein [Enterococcus canis]|uniref:hypothetical protein n=1 Tax=Enterococcus canis TaxID=214095 RepID=UPI00082FBF6F|nr:hypothetical protein [Enterococcus canis]
MSLDFFLLHDNTDFLEVFSIYMEGNKNKNENILESATLSEELGFYLTETLGGIESHDMTGKTMYGVTEIGPVYFEASQFDRLLTFFNSWCSIFSIYEKETVTLKNPENGYEDEKTAYFTLERENIVKELKDVSNMLEKAIEREDDSLRMYVSL